MEISVNYTELIIKPHPHLALWYFTAVSIITFVVIIVSIILLSFLLLMLFILSVACTLLASVQRGNTNWPTGVVGRSRTI